MDDEAKLIEQARTRSIEAFSKLVLLHQGRIRAYLGRYVRSQDAVDDLAQEVFLAAYRSLDTYGGDSPFGLWLLGIARNRALAFLRDDLRRRSRESGRFESVLADMRSKQLDAEAEVVHSANEISALEHCVKNLPANSAQLISEYYFNARSSSELAKMLGRKESAVRMTLLRIRHALRACIQERLALLKGMA
ncbi:MAG TPA: sigma-70 family RNA polymerase sigma factor [Planctomycetota bacterium]|nr:sigma-70 family RNA polymerase sigma factor [Planctomycetota bacterium]